MHSLEHSADPDEGAFATLWKTYIRCQSSVDVNQMWNDAQQLNRAVRIMTQRAQAGRLLPDIIEQALAEPPPRFAVDPKAMAAACALLAGHAAQNAGRSQFAGEMFGYVLSNFSQPRYAYYRAQAHEGLDQIERDVTERVTMVSAGHAHD